MNAPRAIELFAWEWRRVGRSVLLWSILAILAASFVWGAESTAGLHAAQSAAQERARVEHARWQTSIAERARAYRAPVTPDAGEVTYWQDPTSVSGYSQYFLREPAFKPHLPTSPLAVGVSDLAPGRLNIRLNTLFGFVDTYDFENPRGLALGRFDLAFAIAYLLPMGILLLFALLVTFERDRGMLPLIAAQAIGPRLWTVARMAAILAWSLPVLVLAFLSALAIAGVPLIAVAATLAMAALLIVLYVVFWSAIALLVLARQPTAAQALGMSAAIWVGLTTGAPLAISAVADAVDPAPSAVEYVDAQRRVGDAVQAERDTLIARAFASRSDLRAHRDRVATLDHATRLTFLTPEIERRLAPLRAAIDSHRSRQERMTRIAAVAVPPAGIEMALATLAGTDAARQFAFERQVVGYQRDLRRRVYPLVQAHIARAPSVGPRTTRGALSQDAPPRLPSFRFQEVTGTARIVPLLALMLSLTGLTMLLGLLALTRARHWNVAG